jgi:hypothetical protein
MTRHDYFATGTFPWSGLRLAGRRFDSPELFAMMRRQCLSDNCVRHACADLDVLPFAEEVAAIEEHILRTEAAYV